MDKSTKDFLHRQLIKLGDALGDGDCDPCTRREYKKVMNALGIKVPRKNRSKQINKVMRQREKDVPCPDCGGKLKQTRSGSTIASCCGCGHRFRLMKFKA